MAISTSSSVKQQLGIRGYDISEEVEIVGCGRFRMQDRDFYRDGVFKRLPGSVK